jgi:hypothetical protein
MPAPAYMFEECSTVVGSHEHNQRVTDHHRLTRTEDDAPFTIDFFDDAVPVEPEQGNRSEAVQLEIALPVVSA